MDDGTTLSFRARIATGGPVDDLHPDGGAGIVPWPAGGSGYALDNGGKGSFTIHQQSGGTVSFSLALPTDGTTNPTGALLMNNLNGNVISPDVDTGDAGIANEFPLDDPTDWQEFWITIESGGAGTHEVSVYHDGSFTPVVFDVTAGNGIDFAGSYIALGVHRTPFDGAIDIDFSAWAPSVVAPLPPVDSLITDVEALFDDGVINNGNRNALVSKLENANKSLDKANTTAAANQIQAFINQVGAFRNSGKLPIHRPTSPSGLRESAFTTAAGNRMPTCCGHTASMRTSSSDESNAVISLMARR